MHAQSQAPNQSLGQVSRMAQPNGSSLSGSSTQGHRTWHQESDNFGLRRTVVENILSLFQERRGPVTAEWQQKLPDFVKRLEEGLYRQAMTKEEYADQSTLEARLQTLAKRMTKTTQVAPQLGSHGNLPSHVIIVNVMIEINAIIIIIYSLVCQIKFYVMINCIDYK